MVTAPVAPAVFRSTSAPDRRTLADILDDTVQVHPGAAAIDNGPFVAKAAATSGGAASATHFDDVLAYRRLDDFIRRANLAARNWPEAGGMAEVTFNAATLNASMGSTPGYGNLGTSTLNVPGASVTGINNSGTNELTFDNPGGTEGIGGAGGTGGTVSAFSSENAEGVRVTLYSPSQKLGLTLNHFGRQTGQPGNPREQIELKFFSGATSVATLVGQGCRPDGDIATFELDAGVQWDIVEIRAIPPTGGSLPTQFFLTQFLACPAATPCETSMTAGSNKC